LTIDTEIYAKQGFAQNAGIGARPALVTVDFTNGFNDPAHFGGGNIDAAVKRTQVLLGHARIWDWPIAHTRVVYADDGSDAGVFTWKVPALAKLTEDNPLGHLVPEMAPQSGEYIVRKTQASAFFGTNFAPWLVVQGVDTLFVTGCTTSGCVRATVIDAVSSNYRTIVVEDCVGDRAQGPHEANLFDMRQKYADLMSCDEIVSHFSAHAA
jgi:maleamate amidohydrolase